MICRSLFLLVTLATGQGLGSTLFISYLSGANSNPPNGSIAYGTGTITISDDQSFLSATLSMSNLTSAPTLAGIFGPRPAFSSFSPLFLSLPLFSNGPFAYFGSASTSITPQFVSDLRLGSYFFNVFTQAYPAGIPLQGPSNPNGGGSPPPPPPPTVYAGGEASGAISEVPEPGTVLMVAMGVLVFLRARKK